MAVAVLVHDPVQIHHFQLNCPRRVGKIYILGPLSYKPVKREGETIAVTNKRGRKRKSTENGQSSEPGVNSETNTNDYKEVKGKWKQFRTGSGGHHGLRVKKYDERALETPERSTGDLSKPAAKKWGDANFRPIRHNFRW